LYTAGSVVGGTGEAVFGGRRNVGDNDGSLFGPDSPGLLEPMGAEIHFIVRGHGPVIPGRVREMTSTVNGGCPPNTCEDLQMAIHQP
ncbi:MAG: hypothetical protein ACREK1_12815, partial [Longimicrobiales bacterium]